MSPQIRFDGPAPLPQSPPAPLLQDAYFTVRTELDAEDEDGEHSHVNDVAAAATNGAIGTGDHYMQREVGAGMHRGLRAGIAPEGNKGA